MRKYFVFLAIAAVCVLSAVGIAATSASTPRPARVGSPNFVCVSTPYFGVCIGPPTQQG